MEKGQKINCEVKSCRFQDEKDQKCILEAITVAPNKNVNTSKIDESMCASYKCEE